MNRSLPAPLAYGLIVALSLASFALFESERAGLLLSLAVFAIALLKIATILNGFMHLTWRHRPFAPVLAAWLGIVALILAGGMFALPWTA